MRIGGLPGHEIRAQGKGPAGDPVSMVQWLRFGGSGYLRVIAVSPTDKWEQSFIRFRTVRDGIEASVSDYLARSPGGGLSLAEDAGFGAALLTATIAGRSTRSPII